VRFVIENHKAVSWNKLYSSKHWTVRSKLANYIHTLMLESIGRRRLTVKFPVDISIRAYYKDKRRRDSDNICSKLYIDGLVPKILPDDNVKYVRKVTTQAIIGAEDNKIEISIRKLNDTLCIYKS